MPRRLKNPPLKHILSPASVEPPGHPKGLEGFRWTTVRRRYCHWCPGWHVPGNPYDHMPLRLGACDACWTRELGEEP